MKAGLIGGKLGHSFSKVIHEKIADYTYDLMPLTEEEFPLFMENKDFDAINVTIPYKEKVIPYCDFADEKAAAIGAVNTIKNKDGKLFATNTDFDGLKMMIEKHFDISGKTVAVCGSGGTSKTAFAVCKALDAGEIIQVARNRTAPYISYEEVKDRRDIQYIVNTTSVGMLPDIMSCIVDLDCFPACEGVIDVVYNPLMTSLAYEAKVRNIPYVCGLEMLVGQAVKAVEFFTDRDVDYSIIDSITSQLYKDKQNIVLIGMPSCGKSTIGRKLAQTLGMDFVDMDAEIVKTAGTDIPSIFASVGEDGFRNIETQVCLETAKLNHTVISCGGGVVKKPVNMKALALNGFVVYIDRDTHRLQTGGDRPLSSDMDALYRMKEERDPLYRKYSQVAVDNNGDIEDTLKNIQELWNENTGY